MFRQLSACILLFVSAGSVWAQTEKYNPYAPVKEDPPITEDGKVNWPSFFKSASMEDRFQGYFRTGSCVGTNMRIVNMLKDNKVDVNTLPHSDVQVQVTNVTPGMLATVDSQGKKVALVVHPKGVTKIDVSGEILADQVARGMIVRFVGQVDDHAKGIDPITSLEVISLTPDLKPIEVTANHVQTILGKVERRHQNLVTINVGKGKLRLLTFSLPSETPVKVNGQSVDLISAGDLIEAKGPLYTGEGKTGDATIFAEKMVVKKVLPTASSSEPAELHASTAAR